MRDGLYGKRGRKMIHDRRVLVLAGNLRCLWKVEVASQKNRSCISDPRGNHSITTTITVRAGIHMVKLVRELSNLSLPQNAARREQITRTRRQRGRAENDL